MSTKLSFFELGDIQDETMKSFIKGMASERYERNGSAGFMVREQSRKEIRAAYVQKITGTEKVIDPFGNETEFQIVHYLQQEFILSTQPGLLLLINSCSAAKILTGRLMEFADFHISIEPTTLDANRVIKAFIDVFEGVRVFAGTVTNLPISPDTTAKISFQSSGNLERQARTFLKRRSIQFNTLKVKFLFSGQSRECEIKAGGSVSLNGEHDPALQNLVMDTIKPFLSRHG